MSWRRAVGCDPKALFGSVEGPMAVLAGALGGLLASPYCAGALVQHQCCWGPAKHCPADWLVQLMHKLA